MLRLKRPFHRHTKIVSLLISQLGELHSEFFEVESGHFFVQMLGQEVHAQRITLGVVPQFDLGQHLVGEGGTHHEAAFVATGDSGLKACSDWASFGSSPPSLV